MKLALVYARNGRSKTYPLWPLLLCLLVLVFLLTFALSWLAVQHQALVRQHQQLLAQAPIISTSDIHQARLAQLNQELGRLKAALTQLQGQKNALENHDGALDDALDSAFIPLSTNNFAPYQVRGSLDGIYLDMMQFTHELNIHKKRTAVLESWQHRHNVHNKSFISGWPAYGEGIRLSSNYGERLDPFSRLRTFHRGVDIAGPVGTPIHSVAAGVVSQAEYRNGYGYTVEIAHGHGMSTRYAHAKLLLVKLGDVVEKGSEIALMGNSGRSTGPHVHFEVLRHGRHVDPANYLDRQVRG